MGVWGWGQVLREPAWGPARDGRAGRGSGLSWEPGPRAGRGGDEVMEVRHCGVSQGPGHLLPGDPVEAQPRLPMPRGLAIVVSMAPALSALGLWWPSP